MARKKRGVVSAPSSTAASPSPPHGQDFGSYANQRLDASSVAALLSFEYPLIDISLVHALISDHDPASLSAHLDEIRDQLGILQATLVPDDMPGLESALSDPNTSELDHMVQGLNIRLEEDDSPPPLSAGKLKQKDRQGGLSAATVSRSSTSRRSSTSQSNGESNSGSKDERKSNWTNATSIHVEEEVSFDDEMALLQSLFQGLKEKEVREALISEGTVPAAIDYLLSLELIRDVEREGQWPGEDEGNETDDSWGHSSEEERDDRAYLADRHLSSQAPLIKQALVHSAAPDYPTLPSNATTKHPALWVSKKPSSATLSPNSSPSLRPAKVSKRKSTTVRLVDTSQRGSTPTSTRPTSRSVSPNSGRKEPKSLISGPSSNSWGSTASLAEFLSQILGQPQNYFMSWFQRPEYHSAYAAVRASLVNFPEANGKKRSSKATKGNHDGGWTTDEDKPSVKRSEDDERSQAVLEEVYGVSLLDPSESTGDKRIRSDLELCVKIMGKDVAGVMDLMDLLAEIYEWPDDDDLQRYGAVNGTTINQPSARRGSAVGGSSGPTEADVLTDEEEFQLPPPPSPKPTVSLERMITRPAPTRGVLADVAPRTVVGATAPASATLHPTAHDDFGLPSPGASPQLNATRLTPSQRGTIPSSSSKQEHPLNWRLVKHQRKRPAVGLNHPLAASIPSYARGITPHDPTPGSLYRAPAQYSIDECLQYANSERLRRENAIRSVGKHFRSSVSGGLHLAGGKSVNGAVAGHYAIQAREATAKALEWEMKAARMIASDQLKSSRSNAVIDLHHFTINEAKTVVLEVAEKWYETERNRAFAGLEAAGMSRNRTFQPANGLTVITGVGRHSAGQKGVLGPAVQAALDQAGWRVDRDTGRGYVVVKGRR